jgi:hypothetical protein
MALGSLFRVTYYIIGRNHNRVGRVAINILGMTAADVVDQLKKDCLGVELNVLKDGRAVHDVSEDIEIRSVRCLGDLMAVTDVALASLRESISEADAAEAAEQPQEPPADPPAPPPTDG